MNVKTDARGNVIEINSDARLTDTADYARIDQGSTTKHRDAAERYLPNGLYSDNGRVNAPNYKLVDGQLVERTEEERALDPYSDTEAQADAALVAVNARMDDIEAGLCEVAEMVAAVAGGEA